MGRLSVKVGKETWVYKNLVDKNITGIRIKSLQAGGEALGNIPAVQFEGIVDELGELRLAVYNEKDDTFTVYTGEDAQRIVDSFDLNVETDHRVTIGELEEYSSLLDERA